MNIEKSEISREKDMRMTAGKIYEMAKAIAKNEKIMWKNMILSSMGGEKEIISGVPFEILILIIYSCFDPNCYMPDLGVIGYGAGKMAQKYIPQMKKKIEF